MHTSNGIDPSAIGKEANAKQAATAAAAAAAACTRAIEELKLSEQKTGE
jgi:hypothetical protein